MIARLLASILFVSVLGTALSPIFAAVALENFARWQFNAWVCAVTVSGVLLYRVAGPLRGVFA